MPTELERLAFAWKNAGRPKSLRSSAWPDFALFRLQLRRHFTPKLADAGDRLQDLARFVGVPRDELVELLWRSPEEELPSDASPVWCLRRDASIDGALLFRCRFESGQWLRAQTERDRTGSVLRAPILYWKPDLGLPPSLPSFF